MKSLNAPSKLFCTNLDRKLHLHLPSKLYFIRACKKNYSSLFIVYTSLHVRSESIVARKGLYVEADRNPQLHKRETEFLFGGICQTPADSGYITLHTALILGYSNKCNFRGNFAISFII